MFLTYFYGAFDISSCKSAFWIIGKFYPDLGYIYKIRNNYGNLSKLRLSNYEIYDSAVTRFGFLRLRSGFCSQVFVIVSVQFRSFAFIFRNLSQTGSVVLLCLVLTAQHVMSVTLAGAFYLNVKKKRKVRRKTRYFNSRYNLKPRNNILPVRPFTTEYLYEK